MARFQEIAGWLLSSLGVALLVCSLVLVPTSAVMGQGHGGGGGHGSGANCPGNVCDVTCVAGNTCWNQNCPTSCSCAALSPPGDCPGTCECKVGILDCYCGNK